MCFLSDQADALFHQSIIGYSFPRASVGAGSFWNYIPGFNAAGSAFRATYEAMNARLIARGVPSCPTECHCDAASRCGKAYANETGPGERHTETLSKRELFELRPGRRIGGWLND